MLKKNGHIITYLLVFILVVLAVFIFIYKDELLNQVEDYYVLEADIIELNLPQTEELDLSLLNDERFKRMRVRKTQEGEINYFDNLDPLGQEGASPTEKINFEDYVIIGNNRPFR